MNDSSQMTFPRDKIGLDILINGSSKILLGERYRRKFLDAVFWRKVHKRNMLALEHLRCLQLEEILQGHHRQ